MPTKMVREIHREAIQLHSRELPPEEVAELVMAIGCGAGYRATRSDDPLRIVFHTREAISFDSSENAWVYEASSR
jgi:hypothetical protein